MAETENTPLLVDVGDGAAHIEYVPASAHFHRAIKRLTIAILVLSAISLLTLLIGFFIVAVWPFSWAVGVPEVLFLILVRPILLSASTSTRIFQS
jgi:hypothetical protein